MPCAKMIAQKGITMITMCILFAMNAAKLFGGDGGLRGMQVIFNRYFILP